MQNSTEPDSDAPPIPGTGSPLHDPPEGSRSILNNVQSSFLGRRLGQYRIEEKIGQGGMGIVFKALDTALDRFVALKVYASGPLDHPKQGERFLREARALARLHHPNLVHVYNVGNENDCCYFAMELLEGESLSERLARGRPLTSAELLPAIAHVLDALHYIHSQGITHRDVKCGNIMLNKDNRAVLMDFGLAKDQSNSNMTSTGMVLGTPDYISPEVVEGREAGPYSDIYSLGVSMFEALSGTLPFTGKSALSILRQHMENQPPALVTRVPDVDPLLASIIHKCLAKNPAERYHSCPELAAALLRIYPDRILENLAAAAKKNTGSSSSEIDTVALKKSPYHAKQPPAEATKPPSSTPSTQPVAPPVKPPKPPAEPPFTPEMMYAATVEAAPVLDENMTVPAKSRQAPVINLSGKATAQMQPDDNIGWHKWIWMAAGFISVFVAVIVLLFLASRNQKPQGWVVQKQRAGESTAEEMRLVEFRRDGPDIEKWMYKVERRQDGKMVQMWLSHRELFGDSGGGVFEFKE